MRRANSAAPFIPAPAPAAKCEWCGKESDDPLQALVSVCKGCGRASSSRTIRAVSSAPTRRYPAYNHPDSLPPPSFEGLPPVLPAAGVPAKAGPPPLPVKAPKSSPRPVAGRPPAAIPVGAILPPLTAPVIKDAKLSLVSRSESDSALTIPVPAKAGPPRPTPSKAPKAMTPNPLSIIPLGPNSIIPKAPAVFVDFAMPPKKEDALATADTKAAPSYRLPAVSISPIISIPPPPVMMPALGSLPRISITPAIPIDDAYGPEPEPMAANDVRLAGPPPLPTFLGLPQIATPLHMMSAASAKSTAKSGPALLASPLPAVSGPLAAAKPMSLKQSLETVKPTTGSNPSAGTKMLPFILGGIAVGALVAAGIVAKTHGFKPAPSSLATPTTTAPMTAPLVTAPVVGRPEAAAVIAVASASAAAPPPTTTAKPAPAPTALAAAATPATAEAPKAATTVTPEPASAPPSGSFIGAGSLEDARAARAAGDFAKAAAIFNRLAAGSDTQLDALMGLGDMLRANGDINGAKSAYIRALSSAPAYLPAALGAADAAWDLGSIEEARARYHRIQGRYPLRMLPPRVKDRSSVGDK